MEEGQLNIISQKVKDAMTCPLGDTEGRQLLAEIFDELFAASKKELFTGEDGFGEFGLKLSSASAAGCMPDYPRTVKYWQALFNNINRLENISQENDQIIRVLYPGCGPFAALVLPILTLHLSSRIELVLLDVSETSLENAKHLWQSLHNDKLTVSFVNSDVLKYHDSLLYDIIIFECLTKALEEEAQVAITLHVSQLLKDTGKLVPQRIECHLASTSMKQEIEQVLSLTDKTDDIIAATLRPFRDHKLALFKLDKLTHKNAVIDADNIVIGEVDLSVFDPKRDLMLTTVMYLDEVIKIDEYQSGLTFPTYIDWLAKNAGVVNVGYQLRPVPQFFVSG